MKNNNNNNKKKKKIIIITSNSKTSKVSDKEVEEISTNDEIDSDITIIQNEKITVYSRDWTIDTIFKQVEQDNIDLNPKFQRRNAWDDKKKSRLIESFILGLPVPEIVLAEHPYKQKSFIIIDGKQRLLAITGFLDPQKYQFWTRSELSGLRDRTELNGLSFEDIKVNPDILRSIENSDMRCTIISNYKETDVLYDIFYRLNTGSEPLSTQELRQVLNKGEFADFLMDKTKELLPIQQALGLDEPDPRLYDVEFILRYISFELFGDTYTGNLKKFLNNTMRKITDEWAIYESKVTDILYKTNETVNKLVTVFDGMDHVGKRILPSGYGKKTNKVLLEAQLFYFSRIPESRITAANNNQFKRFFKQVSLNNSEFNNTLSGSTKDKDKYKIRQEVISRIINRAYKAGINDTMVKNDE